MRHLTALLGLALLLAGCSDDEPAPNEDTPDDDEPAPSEETTIEDFPEYTLDTATGQCDAKQYDETMPGVYQSAIGGGTWVIQESNGMAGLQYEDNHAASGTGVGFELPVDTRCVSGDQVLV
jgi:hypothetical protein